VLTSSICRLQIRRRKHASGRGQIRKQCFEGRYDDRCDDRSSYRSSCVNAVLLSGSPIRSASPAATNVRAVRDIKIPLSQATRVVYCNISHSSLSMQSIKKTYTHIIIMQACLTLPIGWPLVIFSIRRTFAALCGL